MRSINAESWNEADERTDLVETTIVGKDGNVSVVSASYNDIRSARVEFRSFQLREARSWIRRTRHGDDLGPFSGGQWKCEDATQLNAMYDGE